MLHRSQKLRCEMQRERSPFRSKHIRNRIFIKDLSRWCLWHQYNVTSFHIETTILCSYHACRLIIDIILYKDQKENIQINNNRCYYIYSGQRRELDIIWLTSCLTKSLSSLENQKYTKPWRIWLSTTKRYALSWCCDSNWTKVNY